MKWIPPRLRGVLSIAGVSLLLAGCASQGISPTFGNAVRQNMAAQIVNPDPVGARPPPQLNGVRARDAYDRYETGTVYQPAPTGIVE